MYSSLLRVGFVVLLLSAVAAVAASKQPRELTWDDMIPKREIRPKSALPGADGSSKSYYDLDENEEIIEDPFAGWDFTQPVEDLDGQFVKLPGFVVPLESDEGGMLKEFLLVPYYGACIHTPAPPPNQIVYVTLDEPYDLTDIWNAYWITGTIEVKPYMGTVADTFYRLNGQLVEEYRY